MDGGERICNKFPRSPRGSIGSGWVADDKGEENLRPCVLAAPVINGMDWAHQHPNSAVLDTTSPSRRSKKQPMKRDHYKIVEKASWQMKRIYSDPVLTVGEGSNNCVDQDPRECYQIHPQGPWNQQANDVTARPASILMITMPRYNNLP